MQRQHVETIQREPVEGESVIQDMLDIQESMLSTSGKNMFFKKSQKQDIAKSIANSIDLDKAIELTFYPIPHTNRIVMNYSIFKLFANDAVYYQMIQRVFFLYDQNISQYGNYFLIINLDGFTISAAERYRDFITLFSNICMASDKKYTSFVEKVQILNTPHVFDTIIKMFKPFIAKEISGLIEPLSKQQSVSILQEIAV